MLNLQQIFLGLIAILVP